MARQVLLEELQGCKTYLGYLCDCLDAVPEDYNADSVYSEISRELCRLLFEMDFTWVESVTDDEIRAKDALEIRKIYAKDVGSKAGKSDVEIDRIWKSIHGKPSVLEVIFSLCKRLDEMVNEEESGEMIGVFFRILIGNLGLDEYSDKDFASLEQVSGKVVMKELGTEIVADSEAESWKLGVENGSEEGKSEVKIEEEGHRIAEDIRNSWRGRVKMWLDREYFESGKCGGIFPLEHWKDGDKDQREVSLWYQMNLWLNEHLDDEGQFVSEKEE